MVPSQQFFFYLSEIMDKNLKGSIGFNLLFLLRQLNIPLTEAKA